MAAQLERVIPFKFGIINHEAVIFTTNPLFRVICDPAERYESRNPGSDKTPWVDIDIRAIPFRSIS